MEEVIKIFKELQESSGKRLQEILEENKDNELLKKVLWFVYNPYIVTGLSSKKINKIVNKQIKYAPAETIEEVFEYLQEHNTGTDIDIAYVLEFIQGKPDQEMYSQIFIQELKLGITSKTINKVFPNLIPEFNVMLAEKYWDRMAELDETNPDIKFPYFLCTYRLYSYLLLYQNVGDRNMSIFCPQEMLRLLLNNMHGNASGNLHV